MKGGSYRLELDGAFVNALRVGIDAGGGLSDPVGARYVRPFRGSRELMRNTDRWCFWLVDRNPADIGRGPILEARLEAVASFRSDSKAASTRKMSLVRTRSASDRSWTCTTFACPRSSVRLGDTSRCSAIPPRFCY